jgi:hypothetical protein
LNEYIVLSAAACRHYPHFNIFFDLSHFLLNVFALIAQRTALRTALAKHERKAAGIFGKMAKHAPLINEHD